MNMHMESQTHTGRCFCGTVEFALTGEPVGMGYCHCESCRAWSAGPVNAFTLWPPAALRITRGVDKVGSFHKTDNSLRKWCTVCGGHLMTEHPRWKLIDVYAATLDDIAFRPAVHVNYAHSVLPMKDGLPKHKDFPPELGGTGELMAE
jgi:hypothetical protein